MKGLINCLFCVVLFRFLKLAENNRRRVDLKRLSHIVSLRRECTSGWSGNRASFGII